MITCNPLSLLPLKFSWYKARCDLATGIVPTKSQTEESASTAEAQNSEHEIVNMDSSQAAFVPFQEDRPPMSAQSSRISMNSSEAEGNTGPITIDRTNDETLGINSTSKSLLFPDAVKKFQEKLDQDFLHFEQELQGQNPQDVVKSIEDWDVLENEYQKEVGNVIAQEKDIMDGFDARFKVGHHAEHQSVADQGSNSCFGCRFRMSERPVVL